MNKNIFQLNKLILLSVGLFSISLFISPHTVRAVSVPLSYYNAVTVTNLSGPVDRLVPPEGEMYAQDYLGISLTKEFNLVTNKNLALTDSVIAGTTITSNASYTAGAYWFTGGTYGTPPLDGNKQLFYRRGSSDHENFHKEGTVNFYGGIADYWTYYLTSSNSDAITCSSTTCTAVGNGAATITVNWYNWTSIPAFSPSIIAPYYVVGRDAATFAPVTYPCTNKTKWNKDAHYLNGTTWELIPQPSAPSWFSWLLSWWEDADNDNNTFDPSGKTCTDDGNPTTRNFASANVQSRYFSPNNFSYTITSIVPDKLPTISNITAAAVGYNDTNIAWTYNDADGDTQTWWNTQISTTPAFKKKDIVVWSGEPQTGSAAGAGAKTSNNTSSDFFTSNRARLNANTTYYTRVRAGNAKAETGWVNGPSFRTQAYPQASINFNVEDTGGASGITQDGDPLRFTWSITNPQGVASCTASTAGGTDAGNAIWSGNKPITGGNSPGTLAYSQLNRTYSFRLECAPKAQGGTQMIITPVTRTVSTTGRVASITLTAENVAGNKGSSLTDLRQGDQVSIRQIITNPQALIACNKTVNQEGIVPPDSVPPPYFLEPLENTLASRNRSKAVGPFRAKINETLKQERTFTLRSDCEPVDGPRPIATAQVTANPKPLISCNLTNKVISEDNTNIQVNLRGDLAWSTTGGQGYRWFIDKGATPENFESIAGGNDQFEFSHTLSYRDILNKGFGKYTVRARLQIGSITSDNTVCTNGPVTSLGDRTIREVAP